MKKRAWNNKNQMDSFYHQPTPLRVAPRMGNFQKNRGIKGMRKGAR
ncbi:MAG: hypothetical protein AAB923_01985 [Patescibacteria group bacterium]